MTELAGKAASPMDAASGDTPQEARLSDGSFRRAWTDPANLVVINVACMNAFHEFCNAAESQGRCDCRCHS